MLRATMRSASLLLVSIVTFSSVVAACGSDDDAGDSGPSSSSGSGASSSSSASSSSASSSASSSSSSSSASSGGSGAAGGGGSGGVAEGGAGGAGGSLGGAGGSLGGAGGSDGGAGGTGGATFCVPSSTQACYSGPNGTQDVGICKAGTQTCLPDGSAYGACQGEVVPTAESCANPGDENCNGQADEGCAAVTYSGAVQAIFQMKCSPCHNGNGSGNHNIAQAYAETQKASVVCPGMTIGACALVRIQNGSMPFSAGCTGNPVLDAAKPACLTAAQQQTIQQWIAGGQQP
jgi:hypothetical protein